MQNLLPLLLLQLQSLYMKLHVKQESQKNLNMTLLQNTYCYTFKNHSCV